MAKTKNELLGLVVGLLREGISADEVYSYIEEKYSSKVEKVNISFDQVVERFKGKYIQIKDDSQLILMYVSEINFSGGSAREYMFSGSTVVIDNCCGSDFDSSVGDNHLNFSIDDYNYFSIEELNRKVIEVTVEEVYDLIKTRSTNYIDIILKSFLSHGK